MEHKHTLTRGNKDMTHRITEVYFKKAGIKIGYEIELYIPLYNTWVSISHPNNCQTTPMKAEQFYKWWLTGE